MAYMLLLLFSAARMPIGLAFCVTVHDDGISIENLLSSDVNVLPVDGILSSSTWYAAIPAIPMMTRAAMIAINFFIIYL